jgi:hypothetical protein
VLLMLKLPLMTSMEEKERYSFNCPKHHTRTYVVA